MFNFILAIQIIVAIAMVGLILLQHGKGADAGASFGSGASGTVFGAAGSANFLTRATAVLTAIFFATSLLLAIQARKIETDQRRLDVSELETETPTLKPVVTETSEKSETETTEQILTEAETANEEITTTEIAEPTEAIITEDVVENAEKAPTTETSEMTQEQPEQKLATTTEVIEEIKEEPAKSE